MQRSLREQGFTWAVNHGKQVRLLGLHPDGAVAPVNPKTASAAAAFASAHPSGAHALCLQIPGMGVWLVAACDGCVLSDTDRWFDTLEQAQGCLQGLRDRHEQIVCQTIQWSLDESDAANDQPDFLQASLAKQCRFCRLPSVQTSWPWLAFAIVAIAALGATAYLSWPRQQAVPRFVDSALNAAPLSPLVRTHRPESLVGLFESWHQLPVDPAGWLLQSVACRIDEQQAFCRAAYKRHVPGAHNEDLQPHAPPGWAFEPDSLDRAYFKRTIDMPMQSLQLHQQASTTFGLSQLQRLSARVAGLSIGTSSRLPADTSSRMVDRGQRPFESDAPMTQTLFVRKLTLRLALRQTDRLQELNLPLRWRQADLSIVQGAEIDQLRGYLMLNLQGEWLETP